MEAMAAWRRSGMEKKGIQEKKSQKFLPWIFKSVFDRISPGWINTLAGHHSFLGIRILYPSGSSLDYAAVRFAG